ALGGNSSAASRSATAGAVMLQVLATPFTTFLTCLASFLREYFPGLLPGSISLKPTASQFLKPAISRTNFSDRSTLTTRSPLVNPASQCLSSQGSLPLHSCLAKC